MPGDGFLKDYEPVEERLRQFWSDHPSGRIVSHMIRGEDGDYIFRAEVYRVTWRNDGTWNADPDAVGWAHDAADALPPNMKNSALEVCETSAIGRALANLGYSPKGKRPSREEMAKNVTSGGSAPAVSETATTVPPEVAPTGEVGEITGKDSPASLDSLTQKYGSTAKALMAARKLYGEQITSLSQLDLAQVNEMERG